MVVAVVLGARGVGAVVAFGLGGFAAGSAGRQIVLATRRQGWRGLVGRANGGMVVHLGVVIIAVAVAASGSFVRQAEFTLEPGQSAVFAGHTLTYESQNIRDEGEKVINQALIRIDGTGPWGPSLNRFPNGTTTISTPSVRSTFTDDVALSLISVPDENSNSITVRVTVQPLVIWLWIGGLVMALGTLLAVFPGRRRNPTDPVSAPLPGSRTGAGSPGRPPVDAVAAAGAPPRRAPDDRRDPEEVPA
jgi:cytochrome c-type biogenesis protein CcmF